MKNIVVVLCLIGILAVSSCGGNPPPEPVGSITGVGNPSVFVDDLDTSIGADLFAASKVSTDGTGLASFLLHVKSLLCNMAPSSEAEVLPDGSTLVLWLSGETVCATTGGGGGAGHTVTASGTAIDFDDPVFGVVVARDEDIVKVTLGFVRVASLRTGGSVLLGPGQQSVIPSGQGPLPATQVELNRAEQVLFSELNAVYRIPEADPRIDQGRSEALRRIFERGTLVAAVDATHLTTDDVGIAAYKGEYVFTRTMLDLLAESWRIRTDLAEMPPEEAAESLSAGRLEVFISPEALSGLAAIPFFEDQQGRVWSFIVREDRLFEDDLTSFLRATMERTTYGARYLEAFGVQPSYEAFEWALFQP